MDKYKEMAHEKIAEIERKVFAEFCLQESSVSLLNGLSGVPFFYWNLYGLYKNEAFLQKMEFVIDKVLENANDPSNGLNYCDGLAGVGYMLNFFKNQEILDNDIETYLTELDDLLIPVVDQLIDEGFLDFLHGALGILNYLLQRTGTNQLIKARVQNACEKLAEKIKTEVSMGTTSSASLYDGVTVKHLNLGMAHGLVSNIFFLSKHYECFPQKQLVHEALTQIWKEFDAWERTDENTISIYPSIVNESGNGSYNVPLGWCYGDSITSLGLAKMADTIISPQLMQKATEVALLTIKRDTPETAFINDACLCHGTTSNAQVYKRWFELTGDMRYRKAYENWIRHTLFMGKHEDGIGGYKRYYGDGSRNEYGILNGAVGIGLVLIDFLADNRDSNWDQLLLMN
jgi:lantibiotic modifying enzyme